MGVYFLFFLFDPFFLNDLFLFWFFLGFYFGLFLRFWLYFDLFYRFLNDWLWFRLWFWFWLWFRLWFWFWLGFEFGLRFCRLDQGRLLDDFLGSDQFTKVKRHDFDHLHAL
ncbi:MAG: hypothetical protein CSA47_00710 [Gammaproteobacteria bacterium]|nr:MAG: hypothetical protein CSA47_00710 [Gammaproteobacteria bacterium]